MRLSVMFAGLLVVTLLTGCASSGPVTESYCNTAGPIYVGQDDQLTDETARQILSHNETWASICGG